MNDRKMAIGVVAPGSPLDEATAQKTLRLADAEFGGDVEIVFHQQCFASAGHFAGTDDERGAAFVEVANDPRFSAVWFARGGYGSCRLPETTFERLGDAARRKTYLGYSDMGTLMARLYRERIGRIVHGPIPADINRSGGEKAVKRALDFLVSGDNRTFEPSVQKGEKYAAFNITILSHLLGTDWQPDLTDHIVMLEDVAEYHYRIDRALFTITSNQAVRRVKGLKLGRCSDIPENDREFGQDEEQIIKRWCAVAGIPYLGRADIGHDAGNKIVPFGEI